MSCTLACKCIRSCDNPSNAYNDESINDNKYDTDDDDDDKFNH